MVMVHRHQLAAVAPERAPEHKTGLVLWLDDLDEYLRPGGFSLAALEALRRDRVRIVGTIAANAATRSCGARWSAASLRAFERGG